jgi:hypothetical protein
VRVRESVRVSARGGRGGGEGREMRRRGDADAEPMPTPMRVPMLSLLARKCNTVS